MMNHFWVNGYILRILRPHIKDIIWIVFLITLPPYLATNVDLSRIDQNSNQLHKCSYIFASDASFSKQVIFSTSARMEDLPDTIFMYSNVIGTKLNIFFFIFSLFLFAFFKSFAHEIKCSVPPLNYRRNFGNRTRIEKVITKSRISLKTFGTYFNSHYFNLSWKFLQTFTKKWRIF